ncbi:MAG TPA: TerB family tellurite resistance protein [Paracoccus sp. (in: a-proteobacteria)]|nr:TerB family tellurite resistance protein [Paracoccus sp. (in: a-proteobacteria)]
MFRNLLSRLFAEDAPARALPSQEAEVAVAALLVRVARADDHYGRAERDRIDHVLAACRGIDLDTATERRLAAEMIEAEAPDTVRFTRAIKDRISLSDRIHVIAAMWDVALADGKRTADEDAAVRLAANLLGVNDVDSARARQRVEASRAARTPRTGNTATPDESLLDSASSGG